MEVWADRLAACGFEGADGRRRAVAGVLVKNELDHLQAVRYAGSPSKWLGAADLQADELGFLRGLGRRARLRSRCGAAVFDCGQHRSRRVSRSPHQHHMVIGAGDCASVLAHRRVQLLVQAKPEAAAAAAEADISRLCEARPPSSSWQRPKVGSEKAALRGTHGQGQAGMD